MKNELFSVGPFTVHGYGLMIAIGVIAAYMTAEYRAKKRNMDYEKILSLTIWCFVGGIIGAKLLYFITEIKAILADPSLLLNVSQGFVVYGGIIGGIFAGYLYCKKEKWDFLRYFDLVMPSIALAQGFGRIGCLLAGCCYGEETTSSLSIVFHTSDYAPNGLHLIPTQPISSALNFLNFFVLILLARRVKAKGLIAGFYLTFYSAGRFIIEFFRGDLERGSVGPLSTSQFISIFLFFIGIGIIAVQELRYRKSLALAGTAGISDEDFDIDENSFDEDFDTAENSSDEDLDTVENSSDEDLDTVENSPDEDLDTVGNSSDEDLDTSENSSDEDFNK